MAKHIHVYIKPRRRAVKDAEPRASYKDFSTPAPEVIPYSTFLRWVLALGVDEAIRAAQASGVEPTLVARWTRKAETNDKRVKDSEPSEVKELETKLRTARAKLREEQNKASPSGAVIGKLSNEIRTMMNRYSKLTGKQAFFDGVREGPELDKWVKEVHAKFPKIMHYQGAEYLKESRPRQAITIPQSGNESDAWCDYTNAKQIPGKPVFIRFRLNGTPGQLGPLA
jgi:transposase-like protein